MRSVRLISIRFSGVAMVNAMQKRKKSRRGCVSISMNQRGLCVGALFSRDKRHSRAMTVTKPRNYYFRYSCVSLFEKVRFAIRCPETRRFSIVSFSRDMEENYYWKMFEFSNNIFWWSQRIRFEQQWFLVL